MCIRDSDVTFNEYEQGGSTIVGQANAKGAIAVGAVLYLNTPSFGLDVPTPASFSSRGGTEVNGISRNKPDICAPNGVNTTVDLGGVGAQIDGDEFPNFSGTSAAAPHVAAALALIIEGRQKYLNLGTLPLVAKKLIKDTALDMEDPGFDNSSGAGFIQPQAAMKTFANPTPALMAYEIEAGVDVNTLGTVPFTLNVVGHYLTDSTVVMFGDHELETEVMNDTTVSCIIPPSNLGDRTAVSLLTPPMTDAQLDRGMSNSFAFLYS